MMWFTYVSIHLGQVKNEVCHDTGQFHSHFKDFVPTLGQNYVLKSFLHDVTFDICSKHS